MYILARPSGVRKCQDSGDTMFGNYIAPGRLIEVGQLLGE